MNHKDICKWYNVCPLKRFYEQGKLDKGWVENYCMEPLVIRKYPDKVLRKNCSNVEEIGLPKEAYKSGS